MQDQAVILAIGSELLAGQIANTNGAWLSQSLWDLGIRVVRHVTVDDIEQDIVNALDQLSKVAGVIIVTGGLGPTSDDLTRQAVATWASVKLVYDSPSWDHITKIFEGFQMPAPETNRQQCWFPDGSRILTNRAGTANGFAVERQGTTVIVLPGPPREVEAIWQDHAKEMLAARVPLEKRPILKMWRTIGKGESLLAEVVEPLVQGKGFEVAYRAHAPYVELKLRYPSVLRAQATSVSQALDKALEPWLFERDRENHAAALIEFVSKQKAIDIYDGATQGHLLELIGPYLRDHVRTQKQIAISTSWENHDSPREYVSQICDLSDGGALALVLAGFDDQGIWSVGIRRHGETRVKSCASPYRAAMLQARNLKAVAYLAVKEWLNLLQESAH